MRLPAPVIRRTLVVGALVSVSLAGDVSATSEPPVPEPSDLSSAASDEFCAAAWQIRDAADAIDSLHGAADADPEAVGQAYADLAAATADALEHAPPELADGLDLLAGQTDVALAVVTANHDDLAATETDPRWEALDEFAQLSDLPALQSDVENYVETHCPASAEPTGTSESPSADAVCQVLGDFEAATDAFGEAIVDETSSPGQLQDVLETYFTEIERLADSAPGELSDWLEEWHGIVQQYQDLLEQNDWNVIGTFLDPQMVQLQEEISELSDDTPTMGAPPDECTGPTSAPASTPGTIEGLNTSGGG